MCNIFVIKSNIALKLKLCQGLLITLLDLIKFFDKQSLVDACDSLHRAKVNNKCYRGWQGLLLDRGEEGRI